MSRKSEYAKFLETGFWKEIRILCFNRDQWTCQCCGTTGGKRGVRALHAHHRFYRPDWFDTQLDDLVTLCLTCHEKAHAGDFGMKRFFGSIHKKPWMPTAKRALMKALKKRKRRRDELRRRNQWSF